ncbi:DUF2790 domain-containing protein [Pseudomonas psychrophila]|uniref:DUF2790 domain-containing protein n=1 Tax=Pseudomonas psychrophila TaxID=122355 RepID=A0ABY0W3F2_9PSED|nr:DUF2790 domain-containing protein [Pseudomonas psychrophila]KAB0491041.1 DUF2790 domain-containing protein [Pseudomonas psychrophila]KMM99817.1 hypothetical protein TU76_11525 [Pseudomonas psychrophila]QIE34348.1 DUF2790 domain-containing protein [Pseudomonas psychrophila]WVI96450.1 DUF2790 domain-containing protein [Pseudomonas psychrophila]SDU71458.1 Protein of unknown function [Pseudomonas psychrophila]
MKNLIALFLAGFATLAVAGETSAVQTPTVESYSYGTKLDIARVINLSTIPDVCEVVPATMTYEDSQGQRHILEYKAMGDGCSSH